jgi:hypothetical protein
VQDKRPAKSQRPNRKSSVPTIRLSVDFFYYAKLKSTKGAAITINISSAATGVAGLCLLELKQGNGSG